jgi:transcriptional regulator with XRE-family HTH domain
MCVPISNQFAKLLEEKQRKEDRYISLSDVANDTGVSRKTLYKWERGTVEHYNRVVIEKLCEYFGVGLEHLLVYSPDDTQPKKTKSARK